MKREYVYHAGIYVYGMCVVFLPKNRIIHEFDFSIFRQNICVTMPLLHPDSTSFKIYTYLHIQYTHT